MAHARDRAREEWRTVNTSVEQAREALRTARLHSGGDLVAAFVNHEPTEFVMTETAAQVQLDSCIARLRHMEEIEAALRHESDDIENVLQQRHYDIQAAAGRLLSRSSQFLNLSERIYTAYRTLGDTRLVIDELSHMVNIDDELCRLADNSQPSSGHRFGGYLNDEVQIAEWRNAVTRLLTDADASRCRWQPRQQQQQQSFSPVRGAEHRPTPRRRPGAATPLSRPPVTNGRVAKRRGRASDRRASLARERDPLTGKCLTKKSGDQ